MPRNGSAGEGLKAPSLASLLFGLVPFVALCFTVSLWDRIYPMVFGLPFNFFWIVLWLLLTPVCLYGAYRLMQGESSSPRDGGTPE